MKKAFLLALTALVALLATSCQKEELGRVLTATIEQYEHNAKGGNKSDAKAYINNNCYACWENGDLVSINGTQCTVRFSDGDEHNYSATIQGEIPTGEDLLAFYPAGMVSSWSGDNVTVSFPQMQTYEETTVGGVSYQKIDNPMAAYCPVGGTELKFRNLAALLKVTIQAPAGEDLGVKAIIVKGDDGQMLWGMAPLALDNQHRPMLEKMSNGSAIVGLDFGDSPAEITANSSKSFYIVVPAPTTFTNLTVQVATVEKEVYRKESKLGQGLLRNQIGAFSYAPTDEDADTFSTIFYEGSIEGFQSSNFGDAQVIFNKGGLLIFDRPLTTIGEKTFQNCGLVSIDLPASVTTIEQYAFQSCIGLESISLPASIITIGNSVFMYCGRLRSITLPDNLITIEANVFKYCSKLSSIEFPAGLTSIGESAFDGCSSLSSISLPAGVTSIGDFAFYGCSSLARVDCYATNPPSLSIDTFYGISDSAELHVPRDCASKYMQSDWGPFFHTEEDLPAN